MSDQVKATCTHTPMPESYLARIEWFERIRKTHRQTRCPGCGRWLVWEPKEQQEELTRVTKGP